MVTNTELVTGREVPPAYRGTSHPSLPIVSNMRLRPRVPRASRLTTTFTSSSSGESENACAPRSPASSPSSIRKITGFFGAGPALSARAVSSTAAVPARSSETPGPAPTES